VKIDAQYKPNVDTLYRVNHITFVIVYLFL